MASASEVTGLLTVLESVFTFLVGQLTSLVNIIVANPLLLIPIGISIAFVIVKFFKYIFTLVR